MLFRKDITPNCSYCLYGCIVTETECVCERKGIITNPRSACRRFRYDPMKRTPERPAALEEKTFKAEDFSL